MHGECARVHRHNARRFILSGKLIIRSPPCGLLKYLSYFSRKSFKPPSRLPSLSQLLFLVSPLSSRLCRLSTSAFSTGVYSGVLSRVLSRILRRTERHKPSGMFLSLSLFARRFPFQNFWKGGAAHCRAKMSELMESAGKYAAAQKVVPLFKPRVFRAN